MKPAFALSFSATGITVHHQSDDDWFCIGEVALDAPDLNDQLFALRDRAFALENNLSCKLVIPTEQVRFLTTETDAESAQQALADETPYSLQELIFDTATDGPTTYVAAIAKETLDEARTFAISHGFIPVLVTAQTDPDQFPAEPRFAAELDENAKAEDAPKEPPSSVHAIADTAAPDVFRAPPAPASAPQNPAKRGGQLTIPIAACVAVALVLGAWALNPSGGDDGTVVEAVKSDVGIEPEALVDLAEPEISEPEVPADIVPAEPEEPTDIAAIEPEAKQPEKVEPAEDGTTEDNPALSPTDAAILEALNVAPTPVEEITRAPDPQDTPPQAGITITTPEPLVPPDQPEQDDLYLASVDNSNLSTDAIALPPIESFATDAPLEQVALPGTSGTRFELDERGLVTPSTEGTLNPDGVVVYLGRPSKVPPEPPVRFEEEPTLEEPTDRLAERRARVRPDNLIEQFERLQLGGRTRQELAVLRPKLRPASLQQQPQIDETPTALAVVRVPRPKPRPAGIAPSSTARAANLGSTAAIEQVETGSFQPKAVAPKIPSSASVARQATIDNALNLRKLNLIGVYGAPADRRALVRLPSGRYKKLKVGDRLDGGKVIAISDSELRYQKKGRNLTLKMPRG